MRIGEQFVLTGGTGVTMDGLERRTARIFGSDGKSVVLAFDHGMGGARHAGMKNPGQTLRDCIAAGSDAVLITPGLARQYGDDLTGVGVVMFFLPPLPGIATTIAGLALLSTEYDGAARWLERARARFRRADPDGTDRSAEGARPEHPTGPQ